MALGTAFMALHANQGPRLGLPQMIQSRAQFGVKGSMFMLMVAIFIYVGYTVFSFIPAAEAIKVVAPGSNVLWYVVFAVGVTVLAIVGHDMLHVFQRWSSYLTIVIFAVLTVVVLVHFPGSGAHLLVHHWSGSAFLIQFTAATGYQISYAIYVSDYTRYLPENTPAPKVIGWTFLGGFWGAVWFAWIGAILGSYMTSPTPISALHTVGNVLFPGFGVVVVLGTLPALLGTSAVNNYGAMLCSVTFVDGFKALRPTRMLRVIGLTAVGLGTLLVTALMPANYLSAYTTFLAVLVYLLIPWSAINLVDFYLVRKGHYSIEDIVDPRGRYGQWAWRGITAYVLGFACMLPFLHLSFYHSPVSVALGGGDLSFEVGLPIAGISYLLMCRKRIEFAAAAGPAATFEFARLSEAGD